MSKSLLTSIFSILTWLLCHLSFQVSAQDCNDLQFETKITHVDKGQYGKVQIVIKNNPEDYKIFLVNGDVDNKKRELKEGILANLRPGFYDIIIVGSNQCFKQITAIIEERI